MGGEKDKREMENQKRGEQEKKIIIGRGRKVVRGRGRKTEVKER